ncbi:hypothetical protein ACFLZI_01480, partial [Nitrospirota bacterium]
MQITEFIYKPYRYLPVILLLVVIIFSYSVSYAEESLDYLIGPEDVLTIIVWDNKDLSGNTSV